MSTLPAAAAADVVLARAGETAEVEHEAGLVVLLLDSPRCNPYELSGGGVEIWQRLGAGARTAAELTDEIAAAHELDPATIAPSVAAFLTDLLEQGLVSALPELP